MSDMTGTQDSLAAGNEDLELIERAGTAEVTESFVEAFNNMTPEERQIWIEDANRNILTGSYGWAASFINDPELGPLFRQAIDNQWEAPRLVRAIEQTNWWRSRTASQRQFDQQIESDPATINQQIDRKGRGIRQVVSEFGGFLSDEQVTTLATEAVRSGWDDTEMLNAVAAELQLGADGGEVLFGVTGRGVRSLAADYAVPLSDAAADDWATKIANGSVFQADYENWLRGQSKSLYPTLSADIDRGVSVKTLTDPFRQVAARTLGIAPDSVDFSSDRWNAALNFDDGKGRRMMTLTEWGDHLRTNSQFGYEYTEEAQNKAYTIAEAMGQMFGRVA
jgi:hypothetical protein